MKKENKERKWWQAIWPTHKKGNSFHYILLLGAFGMLLMIVSTFFQTDEQKDETPVLPIVEEDEAAVFKEKKEAFLDDVMVQLEKRYEEQLKRLLEEVVGLSDVSVMINIAESERFIYEKEKNVKEQQTKETDREGGTRQVEDFSRDEQLLIVRQGEVEEPILSYKEKPRIRGVLVVAKGVENAETKGWVVEAVSRVLDVPSHRVSVLPKKHLEEE